MPFNSAEFLQSPVDTTDPQGDGMWGSGDGGALGHQPSDIAGPRMRVDPDWPPNPGGTAPWPPQWDAPPPEMHPDHPSAPVPRVRVPRMPSQRPNPGSLAAPDNAPARYREERPNPPGQDYGPVQDYRTGHAYPPAQDNRRGRANPAARRGDSGQGYPPAGGYDGGQGYGPAPRFQPDPGYPSAGYPSAGGYGPGQGYPQAPGPHGGPGSARLYAVPDSLAAGAEGMSPGGGRMVQLGGQAAALADPAWPGDPQRSASFALAEQMLSNADSQAATITQDAWSQAISIREAAEQDAAAIRQQASAIREAAEKEAAEMRAAILSMSEQLGRLAAYVTENFAIPGGAPTAVRAGAPAALVAPPPAAPPATRPEGPATRPEGPATRPERPATRPGRPAGTPARTATKPGKPATRPATGTRGRQARAARKMVALLAVMTMLGVASGATELALHGVPFFIFRANGAGASETGPVENQGPGQPDAPGTHHAHPAHPGAHRAPPAQQNK